jgi:hypothetical protein
LTKPNRVYSEQEASEILQKAAKMQEAQAVGPDYTPGITFDELQRIAAEAGIDPKVLQQALAEGSTPKEKAKWPFEIERVLEGELAADDFDVVLDAMGPANRRYPITQVGRTLSGSVWTGTGMTAVQVSSRNGRTRLSMKANPFFSLFTVLYPLFIMSAVGSGIASEQAAPYWLIPLIWLAALIVGTVLTPLSLKRHRKVAESKMADLETRISEALVENQAHAEAQRARLASASSAPIESAASQDLTLGS